MKKASVVKLVVGAAFLLLGLALMFIPGVCTVAISANGVAMTGLAMAIKMIVGAIPALIGSGLLASYFIQNKKLAQAQAVETETLA